MDAFLIYGTEQHQEMEMTADFPQTVLIDISLESAFF